MKPFWKDLSCIDVDPANMQWSSFSAHVMMIKRSIKFLPSIGNELLASFHYGIILLVRLEMTRKSTFHDPRNPYSGNDGSR
jgi:hypothetical protein